MSKKELNIILVYNLKEFLALNNNIKRIYVLFIEIKKHFIFSESKLNIFVYKDL